MSPSAKGHPPDSAPGLLEILFEHNLWATAALLDDAARLAPGALQRRFEIGPGSIHDTLRHIIGAMLRWADRVGERPLRPSIERDERARTVAELRELLERADAELREVVARVVADGRLGEPMEIREANPVYRFTRAAAVLHVLTHGERHRAQILNMRRQLGLPALELDLNVLEWECAPAQRPAQPPAAECGA